MAVLIHMPEIAANATSATLYEWLKQEGDSIAVGDAFVSIETEKALVDYQADVAGVLGRILSPAGQDVAVGAPIAVLLAHGETAADINALLASGAAQTPQTPQTAPAAPVAPPAQASPATSTDSRIFASPSARRVARELGVDLLGLCGSGPRGRIVKCDVEAAARAPAAPIAQPQPQPAATAHQAGYEEIPHSNMRRTIARRLTESKTTIPHFYLTAQCRMDRLNDLRAQVNATASRKISVNDFIVKAVAAALRATPQMNVSWTETALRRYTQADISVAVATDAGLITPVVRGADSKSLSSISHEIADLATRARNGKLSPDEYQGGSFTISNLGMFGVQSFVAIINPPQAAILAVGATLAQPIVEEGVLGVAQVLTVTLSVDHRAVDGAIAAQWLATFKNLIENPLTTLI
ncbi:pyruvate dehydrogenase complex dihydrolipoamide acetyltransferase, long form [Pseudomonas sp. GM78]|uniref:pyruvate dehydrogenase complex dihydrolipoamide acetyltransferase n=1 Tax=Pseudomonas sp. GM78 TaxID=1144337 RepID=UPI000270B206|nr:pyruvate dehydrogenase complex dihydrolipoamide acetyltransferase [Pseudomonas sp. GM78]EJN26863.1 pyruvate dehydrogenase complex dihydrolipoamide acetyltransferase, long form [Pseudomonas sp. GM78]